MKFSVTVDDRLVRKLIKKFPKMLDDGVAACAHEFKRELRDEAPVASGKMRGSANVFKNGYALYRVGMYARSEDGHTYANYVDQGTGERRETFDGKPAPRGRIYPKHAKAFKWDSEWGAEWYAKSIAGIHAQHFMKDAYDSARPRFRRTLLSAFQQRI